MAITTTTIFNIIRSELIKKGHSEFESVTPQTDVFPLGEFVFYMQDYQFTEKTLRYDEDVTDIIDYIFFGVSLNKEVHDKHFKKGFLSRFVNRQINRQIVETIKMELLSTYISNETFINTIYEDLEKYIEQTNTTNGETNQINKQLNDGSTTTDNRQAFADLPQSSTNLDVDNTVM